MRNPLRKKSLSATPAVLEIANIGAFQGMRVLGGNNLDVSQIRGAFIQAQSASYAFMYGTQPAVRTVVDYIARNIAQLSLCLYERVSENDRRQADDEPPAETVRFPNSFTPGQAFIFNLVADFLIYDNAYVLKLRPPGGNRLTLINVPPSAVGIIGQQRFIPDGYRFWRADGTFFDVPPSDVIHWRGYNPDDPRAGFSKLETLRQELATDAAAREAKTQLDQSGLIPKGWIERPLEAPDWDADDMKRFMESWANMAKNSGRKTPVLEEGMAFKQSSVSPEEAQLLQARKFTEEQVAALYGLWNVPPESEDERRGVYADVLPPYCEMLCSYLELQLLQAEFGLNDYYFQFNLDEKLRGEPITRWAAITSSVGRPWRSVNEARALEDLPPVEDGDEMTIPLNVQVGNVPPATAGPPRLPAPNVMPIQDPNKPPQDGSYREQPKAISHLISHRAADMARQKRYIDESTGVMERFYSRQSRELAARKAFDLPQWNKELGIKLYRLAASIVEREGGIYIGRLGGADFDMRVVQHYLKALADGAAEAINQVTHQDIQDFGTEDALARAKSERAQVAGASIGARATRFARYEAAKQAPDAHLRQKTYVADTDRHAEFDGETVPINDHFSSGFEPGSPPNCSCTVTIT